MFQIVEPGEPCLKYGAHNLTTTASQCSNTVCCRHHKGEVYTVLQDITLILPLDQYFYRSITEVKVQKYIWPD